MKVTQSCLTLCNPMDCTVHGILQARIPEWVAFPFSRGSSNPGIQPKSPTLQADSLPAELREKPKNTGVGSLSLLQQLFPIQELNRGLLHCRRILYQLSYQGSPSIPIYKTRQKENRKILSFYQYYSRQAVFGTFSISISHALTHPS